MTHTPDWERRGWMIVNPDNYGLILDGRMRRPKSIFDSFIWDSERSTEEQTANIILATTAPELLQRLKDARGAIASLPDEAMGIVGDHIAAWPFKLELLDHIDGTIARAEGTQ